MEPCEIYDPSFGLSEESRYTGSKSARPLDFEQPDIEQMQKDDLLPTRYADYGKHRKNYRLIQLDSKIFENDDLYQSTDPELLDYLTAPPSVQQLNEEIWLVAWKHVCKENEWLEMRNYRDCGLGPYCKLCNRWAEVPHLLSDKCTKARADHGGSGPLLTAILAAEEERKSQGQRSRAEPGLQSGTSGGASSSAARPMYFDTSHLLGSSSGSCAKPGCCFRSGGRGSPNHCCKRCQKAHEHGVHRLYKDPDTGETWKKRHGPGCTCHIDRRSTAELARLPLPSLTMPRVSSQMCCPCCSMMCLKSSSSLLRPDLFTAHHELYHRVCLCMFEALFL